MGRIAMLIVETEIDGDGNYIPCFVQEGETGYYTTTWTWGSDKKVAKKCADKYNADMELTEKDVRNMILQSLREQEDD